MQYNSSIKQDSNYSLTKALGLPTERVGVIEGQFESR